MELKVEKANGIAVLEVPLEELDASNATEFKEDMTAVIETHARLVLDLTRLRFVDSSGLGAFISCLRKVTARGGELKLCSLSRPVRSVFELVRMHRVFEIHATREAALAAFGPKADAGESKAAV